MLCKGIVTGGPAFLWAAGLLPCTVGRLVFNVCCQAIEFLKGPPWSWGSARRTLNTLKLFAVNLSGASQCLLVCFVGGKVNSSQTACAEYPPTSYFVIRKAKLEQACQPLYSFIVLLPSSILLSSEGSPETWCILVKGKRSVKEFVGRHTY